MVAHCVPGELGQFQVVVDGEVVAERDQSPLKRLVGGGWPDPQQVVLAIGKRMSGAKSK